MSSDEDTQAELRALREENEALRYASLKFGELSERLTARVRVLERRVEFYQRLWATHGKAVKRLPALHPVKSEKRAASTLRRR